MFNCTAGVNYSYFLFKDNIMKEMNLVLNEQSIKRHIKRLSKVLKNHPAITVSESVSHMDFQEIFSQALGFKNWHELHMLLQTQNQEKVEKENAVKDKSILNDIEYSLYHYLEKTLTKKVCFNRTEIYLPEIIKGKMFLSFIIYLMDKQYPHLKLFDHFKVSHDYESIFYYNITCKNPDIMNTDEFKAHFKEIVTQQEDVDGMYDFSPSYEKHRNDFSITLWHRVENKYSPYKNL